LKKFEKVSWITTINKYEMFYILSPMEDKKYSVCELENGKVVVLSGAWEYPTELKEVEEAEEAERKRKKEAEKNQNIWSDKVNRF
jgi:hypothetical protein